MKVTNYGNNVNSIGDHVDVGCIIGVEGGIAFGKSTLAKALKTLLQKQGYKAEILFEPLNMDFLELYKSDKAKYAFPFQCVMARERCQVYQEALRLVKQGTIVIMDRSLFGDVAFATMFNQQNMYTADEWKVYNSLVGLVDAQGNCKSIGRDFMPEASVIYLDVTPENAFRRMLERGIESEVAAYTPEYFENLDRAYKDVMNGCCNCSVVDWNDERVIDDACCIELLDAVPALRHLVVPKNEPAF